MFLHELLPAFLTGGLICALAQILIDKTKLTPARILVGYVAAGVLFGVYGKVQTLFNLPAAFMTPLTIAIVPAVAGAIAKGNRHEAERQKD